MTKSTPTLGRILVMVGFTLSCFGLLLFLWLAFGGPIPFQPRGYQFHVQFPEAVQLAKQADVRISGVPVGKVVQLEPDPKTGLTDATIQMDEQYAPIPKASKAILRSKTLLGETYVELTPGKKGVKNAVPEDGQLKQGQVASTVQLDEIFRAFNPATRKAFKQWMTRQVVAFDGRGQTLNDALGNLAPTVEDSNALLQVLNSQHAAVRNLVRNSGTVLNALDARDSQLQSLIRNNNQVFSVLAKRNNELQQIFEIFPTFQDESRATFIRLNQFAADATPLIDQLRPAVRQLSPTLQDLARLAPDLSALFEDLEPLIRASRKGLPALQTTLRQLRPLLGQLDPFLRQVNPILSFLGFYKSEITTFFANTVAATQATTFPDGAGGPVHYLRTTNPVNPEALAVYQRRLASSRPNPYMLPRGYDKLGKPALQVFENRQCTGQGSTPQRPTDPANPIIGGIGDLFYGVSTGVKAPPCNLQPPVG